MILKAIFDFLLSLMACRLRATAVVPASSVLSTASQSSSSLESAGGDSASASIPFELPAEPPLPHDSMELRRDLSVSVVPLSLYRRHATTYRRARTASCLRNTTLATVHTPTRFTLTSLNTCYIYILSYQHCEYYYSFLYLITDDHLIRFNNRWHGAARAFLAAAFYQRTNNGIC